VPTGRRIQWAFVVAGGVIANLLAILACASSAIDLAVSATMAAIAGATGVIIISVLFPRRIRIDGVRVGSDGLQFAMLFLKQERNSFARRLMEEATTAIPSTGGEYRQTLLGRPIPTNFEMEWSQ
jgi:hypothetical protein